MKILTKLNWPITLASLLLLSIGILTIYSTSMELALQQFLFACGGILIYLFVSQFDYRSIGSLIKPFFFLVGFLLILVLILGMETRGVVRWIPLGLFNIQPSEFAKVASILFLANFWANNLPSWRNILQTVIWIAPLAILIFRQPDLGSFLTIFAIWLGMLLVTITSPKKVLMLFLFFVLTMPLSWFLLADYQKERFIGFLTPESDPLGRGYNLIQSTIAVGSGEVFGRGLGRGTQSRLQFLPEFRTDFIFASIAEELGFLGSIIILSLYLFLLTYCLKVAASAADTFGFLIAMGVVSMLLFQTVVNIGMNIGLLPITGITLPIISYGGSSLVATMVSLGMVASVSVAKFTKRV